MLRGGWYVLLESKLLETQESDYVAEKCIGKASPTTATGKMMNNHAPWCLDFLPLFVSTPHAALLNLEVVEVLSSIPVNFSVFSGCHNCMENPQFQSSYLVSSPKKGRSDSQYRKLTVLKLLRIVLLWQFLWSEHYSGFFLSRFWHNICGEKTCLYFFVFRKSDFKVFH